MLEILIYIIIAITSLIYWIAYYESIKNLSIIKFIICTLYIIIFSPVMFIGGWLEEFLNLIIGTEDE